MVTGPSSLPESTSAVLMSIGVEHEIIARFESGFRRMNVDVRVVRMRTTEDIDNTRFDGCIIRLDEWAAELLARVRQSSLSTRALVYGIGALSQMVTLARFDVNAVIEEGAEAEINQAIQASYLLLLGRNRRFLRLPLVVPVEIEGAGQASIGFSTEISGGGMTIETDAPLPRVLRLRLTLSDMKPIELPALVCWRSARKSGVQFLESADLETARDWIDRYLGIDPGALELPLAATRKPE